MFAKRRSSEPNRNPAPSPARSEILMPIRTTPQAVKELMAPGGDYDLRRAPSLVPAITTASVIIDDLYDAAIADGWTAAELPAARMELVERWLAAHCYQQSDKGYTSRSTQGASGSFQGQTTMGLDSTLYGQTAKAVDPTGLLSYIYDKVNAPPEIGGTHLGTPTSRKADYEY